MHVSFQSTSTRLISVPSSTAQPIIAWRPSPFCFLFVGCAQFFRAGTTHSQRQYSNINKNHFIKIRVVENLMFQPEGISRI